MDDFLDKPVYVKPIILGFLGKHESVTKQTIHDEVLHPLMSVLGRLPERILVSSEGTSSAYISIWGERNEINTQIIHADWKTLQRRAGIMRDARIIKECSHLVIFQGLRSKAYEQTAIREAKKGKRVFLVDHGSCEMSEIVIE
jgi:hypothetical protein